MFEEIVTATVAGSKHREARRPGQDAVYVASSERLLAVAVSDGVGSCPDSHHGSQAAVSAACEHAVDHYQPGMDLLALVRSAVLTARQAVEDEALALGKSAVELGCNLTIALIDDRHAMIASLGDCVQALRYADGTIGLVAMLTEKEYAQHTDTLGARDLDATVRTYQVAVECLDAIVLGSDGLEPLAVRGPFSRPRPSSATIHGLLDSVRLEGWTRARVEAMLEGPAVAKLTSDDVTIAMVHIRGRNAGRPAELTKGGVVHVGADAPWPATSDVKSYACSEAGGLVLVQAPDVPLAELDAAIANPPPVDDGFEFAWPTDRAHLRRGGTMLLVRPWGGRAPHDERVCARIRALLASLHESGRAHGRLTDDLFAMDAYGTVQLRDCRAVLEAGDLDARCAADLAYAAGLSH